MAELQKAWLPGVQPALRSESPRAQPAPAHDQNPDFSFPYPAMRTTVNTIFVLPSFIYSLGQFQHFVCHFTMVQ